MFSSSQLKDLEIMVERYREHADKDSKNPLATESIKRTLAREVLKADEILATIRGNVKSLARARDAGRPVSAFEHYELGSDS